MLKSLLLTLTLVGASALAAVAQKITPLGVWQNEEKEATFEIYPCGDKLCGKIISLSEPNDAKGRPKTDTENPDPKLRSRSRLGMVFMQDFAYTGSDNKWDDGKIYDPKSGKTYSCYMKMENANRMEVKGYIGFSMIGRSQSWTRVK